MRSKLRCKVALLAVMSICWACDRYPEDPESSLENALATGVIRVGLADNDPWVKGGPTGERGGVEVRLIEAFAKSLGVSVEWRWGGTSELMEGLTGYELDIVACGLTTTTPWKKKIGMTMPYYTSRWLIGIPSSMQPPFDPEGKTVLYPLGTGISDALEKKEAVPKAVPEINGEEDTAVAAEHWKLDTLGFSPTDIELKKDRHVFAVAPGENALLMRLEDFLFQNAKSDHVNQLLREEGE